MQAGPQKIGGLFKLTVTFVRPDQRHRDLDNLLKALLDCLQHAGVITNDKNCVDLGGRRMIEGHPCSITLEDLTDG